MSVMQKLLEINDELVRTLAERDRLQAQCEELRSDQKTLQEVCVAGRQRIAELQAELAATRKQLQDVCSAKSAGQNGLVRDVSHYIEAAEVDRPTEPQPAEPQQHPAEYTPPEGWRLLQESETLQKGDMWVRPGDGRRYPTKRVGSIVRANQRYIRPIEPEPQPVQVREGRWRTRGGEVKDVTPTPPNHVLVDDFPWWDGIKSSWRNDGRYVVHGDAMDLVEYLGAIEPEQEFKPYTFAAYIVGDKSQPDALRIVLATEEWIQHADFSIVHRLKDTDSFETLTLNLKVQ